MATLREGTAEEAGFDAARLDLLRQRARSWVDDGLTSSLVLLAARRGVIALHEAFGRFGPEPDALPLMVDAVFPVSSLCKPMTAALLMTLVEDGLVSLDVPVRKYLPDHFEAQDPTTARHLLTHTAGIVETDVLAAQAERLKAGIELPPCPDTQHRAIHRSLEAARGYRARRAPGEAMMYSTHGYQLVSEIVRRVSGRSLASFAQERLFEPLGMVDSSYLLEDRHRGRMVRRDAFSNQWGANLNDEKYLSVPWGGGGLKSTAVDIARFGQLFLNGGRWDGRCVLSRATVAQMARNQIPDGVPEEGPWGNHPQARYGLGYFVLGDERWPFNGALVPPGTYGHSGMGGTAFWIDPFDEVVGVFLSVWKWPEGLERSVFLNPPLLSPARFQDMVTAAVM